MLVIKYPDDFFRNSDGMFSVKEQTCDIAYLLDVLVCWLSALWHCRFGDRMGIQFIKSPAQTNLENIFMDPA